MRKRIEIGLAIIVFIVTAVIVYGEIEMYNGVPIDKNLQYSYLAYGISVMAILLSLVVSINNYYNTVNDKKASRKTILVKSIQNSEDNDLERVVEYLYGSSVINKEFEEKYKNHLKHGILKEKTIDKIEILNTNTGANNDNRKDLIIIYH